MPHDSTQTFAPEFSYVLDGRGGGESVSLERVEQGMAAGEIIWAHLDRSDPGTDAWLRDKAGLDEPTRDALLVADTRPRARVSGAGIMVILRVPNQNKGDSSEDMIALRLWVEARRIFSVRLRRLDLAADVGAALLAGTGPSDTAEVLSEIVERVLDRLEPVLDNLEERVDVAEDRLQDETQRRGDDSLADLRRELAIYYRHLKPQRSALVYLGTIEHLDWYEPHDVVLLHEASERTARMTEDLETLRERAELVHEEWQSLMNAQLSRRMYVSAIAAALFLPLTFLTGLLGINVGGIPLGRHPNGFYMVCVAVLGLGILEVVVLWRRKWL